MKNLENNKNTLVDSKLKEMLASLTSYLIKRLKLKELPSLVFVNSYKNSNNPFGLTGYYDPVKKQIKIYLTNRHHTDILRSFAHEMIHHWQNMRGTLNSKHYSDQYNITPYYAQLDPWLRKREMEAYLFGCMLFRDWQDEQRMGPPPKEPFLPQPYD